MTSTTPRLLGLGARFPDFSLQACVSANPGAEFRTVNAQELEGGWSAVFFWPRDFTFVCPTELIEFNRALREFRALGTRVFGVSADSEHAHLAWRKENPDLRNLEFPMLADDRKEVSRELGILDPVEDVPLRATYLLDQERKIRWLCINDLSGASRPSLTADRVSSCADPHRPRIRRHLLAPGRSCRLPHCQFPNSSPDRRW
jgi:alkyl hydroperoxide reductase subunit AhpC